jgi:hypothetical protein
MAPQPSPFVEEKLHNSLSYQYIIGVRSFVPVTFEYIRGVRLPK